MTIAMWLILYGLQGTISAAPIAPPPNAPVGEFTPLEITKLAVDALTPILVVVLGIYVHRLSKRVEQSQWANQKLVEKRIAVYDVMAPLLNDLLCFCTFVGSWQTLDPPAMVTLKRTLDRHFHVAQALFSSAFGEKYHAFLETCYRTYHGHGEEARFRIGIDYRPFALGDKWKPEWAKHFLPKDTVTKEEVRSAYEALMDQFAIELGLNPQAKTILPRRPRRAPVEAAPVDPRADDSDRF